MKKTAIPFLAAAVLLLACHARSTGDPSPVDFAALRLTRKPNQYLVCPKDLCSAQAHGESPVFSIPVDDLIEKWDAMIARQKRVKFVYGQSEPRQREYVARTFLMRFPDIITVRFLPLSEGRSSLAVYSRSVYGHSDFGKNRKRIDAWLTELQ